MKPFARKSDGRRIFTETYKREQIDRVLKGEVTVAELSRKLGIARSLLQRWKRLMPETGRYGSAGALKRELRPMGSDQFILALHRLIDRQPAELQQIRKELDALKRALRSAGSQAAASLSTKGIS
jgi:transposase-like protein